MFVTNRGDNTVRTLCATYEIYITGELWSFTSWPREDGERPGEK